MSTLAKCVLLFTLNWLDAQLTLVWIRAGLATEGNWLMAQLLESSDMLFLGAKIAIGLFAAFMFYRFSHLRTAQRGVKLALAVYSVVMLIHLATGVTALGWSEPEHLLAAALNLPGTLVGFFV